MVIATLNPKDSIFVEFKSLFAPMNPGQPENVAICLEQIQNHIFERYTYTIPYRRKIEFGINFDTIDFYQFKQLVQKLMILNYPIRSYSIEWYDNFDNLSFSCTTDLTGASLEKVTKPGIFFSITQKSDKFTKYVSFDNQLIAIDYIEPAE